MYAYTLKHVHANIHSTHQHFKTHTHKKNVRQYGPSHITEIKNQHEK